MRMLLSTSAAIAGAAKPASYQESQQRAFAALMGQAVPQTNGNKADQPAASTPQRARQLQTEGHAKSATAAPTSSPPVLPGES